MKKFISMLLACLMLFGAGAMAAGNATIAVQGQNGFEDYVSSMFIWGDRLMMVSYNGMYAWSKENPELQKIEGYDRLGDQLMGQTELNEDGELVEIVPPMLELEEGEYAYLNDQMYMADGRLYRMAQVGGEDGVERILLVEVVFGEDGALSLGEIIDFEDQLLVDYGDGSWGYRDLQSSCSVGRVLYGLSYGENGREMLAVDLDAGTVEAMTLDMDGEVQGMSPYTEGKLLLVASDYNQDPVVTTLSIYDIESEEVTALGEMPRDGWQVPSGICYDAARGKVYYVLAGSVWRMDVTDEGFGEPEEFGDMPLESYGDSRAVLMDDLYILSSYDGVVGRDVTLDKLPEQRLHVVNSNYSEGIKQAYYSFTDAHPEYMVSMSRSMEMDALLSNMMNRASDVDIYTISSTQEAFNALMNRGFMAELGGSDTLRAAVEAMYPAVKDAAMKDGEVFALPMDGYIDSMTINKTLLKEKFGFADEDMPQDWPALLDLVAKLSDGRMLELPETSLLGPYYTKNDTRMSLFYKMLGDYFLWLDADEANLARGTEVLLTLCEKFEAIDWDGFSFRDEDEEEGAWGGMAMSIASSVAMEYVPENVVFGQNSLNLYNSFGSEDQQETVALAVVPGEAPKLGMTVSFAFVNPFSQHREAAIEYLEYAWNATGEREKMSLTPDRNEPVLSPYYEESIEMMTQSLEDMRKALENAADEETREMMAQDIANQEEWLKAYEEEGRYDVSPKAIEKYRSFDEHFAVARSSVWSSGSGEQVHQYLDGAITAQQLAAELEKTLQMRRMEGM